MTFCESVNKVIKLSFLIKKYSLPHPKIPDLPYLNSFFLFANMQYFTYLILYIPKIFHCIRNAETLNSAVRLRELPRQLGHAPNSGPS